MPRTLDSAVYKRLIKRLKDERVSKGETQTSLALKLKRPQSFIAKIEGLERKLDVFEFIQFCDALEVDPGSLIQRASKKPKPRK
jgi:transcriptional regulator with XRE-family HTH domain